LKTGSKAAVLPKAEAGLQHVLSRVLGAKHHVIKAHCAVHDFQNHPQQVVQLVIAQQGGCDLLYATGQQ
jgi:hypothetical protein